MTLDQRLETRLAEKSEAPAAPRAGADETPLSSEARAAAVLAKYLDITSREGRVSFRYEDGMLRFITDTGESRSGLMVDYLTREQAEQLRDKLNEWYPVSASTPPGAA